MRFDAILFDLDGTLVDSAPDLAAAANELLALRGRAPLAYATLRPHAGSGARGMIGAAFGLKPGEPGYDSLREQFLLRYAQRLLVSTQVFDEVLPLLAHIEAQAWPWAVVTNKSMALAAPLMDGLGLRARAKALVGGDSTPHTKPHPAPLLRAAALLAVEPSRCVYIGDDHRDVLAGQAAGMSTVAASWGYLGPHAQPAAWGADVVAKTPADVLKWLELA